METRAWTPVPLEYRPPYDWAAMLGFLSARAIEGVEEVAAMGYRRIFVDAGRPGRVEVAHDAGGNRLVVSCWAATAAARDAACERVRRLFDLESDVATIGRHLARDAVLAPLVAARPGLRVPGAWDGFELGVRAILGQQVTLAAGRRLAGRLVALCGQPVDDTARAPGVLTQAFPSPAHVIGADLGRLGMPAARRATLVALAEEAAADSELFSRATTLVEAIARFRSIRGIGEWTAQYIALRALRLPDAFPSGDVALARAVGGLVGERPSAAGLVRRAETWRPWRGYAAQHLWTAPVPPRDEYVFIASRSDEARPM